MAPDIVQVISRRTLVSTLAVLRLASGALVRPAEAQGLQGQPGDRPPPTRSIWQLDRRLGNAGIHWCRRWRATDDAGAAR